MKGGIKGRNRREEGIEGRLKEGQEELKKGSKGRNRRKEEIEGMH